MPALLVGELAVIALSLAATVLVQERKTDFL